MPQFDITTYSSQIFWLLFSFGVLMFGMVWLILPRLNQILSQRADRIRQDLAKAEQLYQTSEQKSHQRLQRLQQAEAQAAELIHHTMVEMEQYKTDCLLDLQQKLDAKIQVARESLSQEHQALESQIQSLVSSSVQQLLPKLLGAKAIMDKEKAS